MEVISVTIYIYPCKLILGGFYIQKLKQKRGFGKNGFWI